MIRTLVGSIGLVLAVPLTTAIGVAVVRASRVRSSSRSSTSPSAGGATGESEQTSPGGAVSQQPAGDGESGDLGPGATTPAALRGESPPAGQEGRRGSVVIRKGRRNRHADDLDFSDLHEPADEPDPRRPR